MSTIAPRPRLGGFTAEAIFVRRSLRHSVRDAESLIMSVALPVVLMLMFTYVFGGAIDPTGGYVDY
ncbi:MAG: ABC transporter permease, partial [Microbacterium gubbeenense]